MFHIIDDWYIMPDDYSWMVARKVGMKKGSTGNLTPQWRDSKWHKEPEDALRAFTSAYIRDRARSSGAQGELGDLLIFLSSEHKRLEECLDQALAWAKGQQADAEG